MCEEIAGRFIQNVDQPDYMEIQKIILADGSSKNLREEKGTDKVGDAQGMNRPNVRKNRILLFCSKSNDRISLCHAGVVKEKRRCQTSAEKNGICYKHLR